MPDARGGRINAASLTGRFERKGLKTARSALTHGRGLFLVALSESGGRVRQGAVMVALAVSPLSTTPAEPERPGSLFDPRSLRQANIATSALVIARTLISIIPNTNCTTQPT